MVGSEDARDGHQPDRGDGGDAQPAHDHRHRQRELHAARTGARRVAHRRGRLAHGIRNAVDPGDDAPEQDLERVAHERDLGGEGGKTEDRRQQDEQRQARDRVHDTDRRVEWLIRDAQPQRHGREQRRQHEAHAYRDERQLEVLHERRPDQAEVIGDVRPPDERRGRRSLRVAPCRSAPRRASRGTGHPRPPRSRPASASSPARRARAATSRSGAPRPRRASPPLGRPVRRPRAVGGDPALGSAVGEHCDPIDLLALHHGARLGNGRGGLDGGARLQLRVGHRDERQPLQPTVRAEELQHERARRRRRARRPAGRTARGRRPR